MARSVLAAVLAAVLLAGASARDIIVGGDQGWTNSTLPVRPQAHTDARSRFGNGARGAGRMRARCMPRLHFSCVLRHSARLPRAATKYTPIQAQEGDRLGAPPLAEQQL